MGESVANFIVKMAPDRALRENSFGISAAIAFAFVISNSRYVKTIKKG
ncbi:hypothetical protein LEP1GSC193_3439 [Leptospira alstonii serovar Pingchang str. 80-412]|uniref:Uncharacterized protein n=2 Tax=Leptospira alstonii TaxID=28452 RepID=M6CWF3_9LEPT|nr:hypothetical protein LEP1GSC194_3888 [Leptospira alstonii serovar Sichuan str. 79601]EQA82030.1 hypothetical protein LEP1GSC193_3439 [Leptospira alstonii serovar Pingchang str. 80-412]